MCTALARQSLPAPSSQSLLGPNHWISPWIADSTNIKWNPLTTVTHSQFGSSLRKLQGTWCRRRNGSLCFPAQGIRARQVVGSFLRQFFAPFAPWREPKLLFLNLCPSASICGFAPSNRSICGDDEQLFLSVKKDVILAITS